MSPIWLLCSQCKVLTPTQSGKPRPPRCPSCQTAFTRESEVTGESLWYVVENRQKTGPVSWHHLKQMVANGRLKPADMVLQVGSTKWLEVRSVAGLVPGGQAERPTPVEEGTVAHESTAPAAVPMPTIDGYELLAELGRGGMGVVYKAKQLGLGRLVALKMILAGAHAGAAELARFRAEAEAVARLQHPNIVQVHEIGAQAGQPYFSLEYVDGGTLSTRSAGKPLPPHEAAGLVQTLASAVHYAHERGIVHRDLKPANVLLTRDGQPKIVDFGLAKQLDGSDMLTRSGAVLGTPSYLSPEQAAGKTRDIGPPCDVYALGAILYELLTGSPPFRGASSLDTILLVMTEEPVRLRDRQPGVPGDLETICHKCLNKTPAQRYASAAALADDLGRFRNGEPILARPAGKVERAWRWCVRNPIAASFLVAVSLLLIVVTLGAGFGLFHLSRLSEELVRSTALESAAQEAELLDELNNFYSAQVVDRVKPEGIEVTHDYTRKKGAIPLPATLTIDLGNHISAQSKRGVHVRLYSDYPFTSRKDGGPRDAFEWEAMGKLRMDPTRPVYRFEEYKGRPTLRYATARVMKASCVKCHNEHPDSPKRNWQVGDVRGVVELLRPLDQDEERTRQGLRGPFELIAVLSGMLLIGLSSAVCVVAWWGRKQDLRSRESEPVLPMKP
ncbi:MAG: protein kinase [Gemmataceae bacterium]